MSNIKNALHLEQQGQYLEAEKQFRALVKQNSNNGQAHWGLGRLALKAERVDSAITFLNKACHLLPREPLPLIHLAGAFNRAFSEQDALTVLEYGITLAPNMAQMHYELAQQQLIMGLLPRAQQSFATVLTLDTDNHTDLLKAFAFFEISRLKKIRINDPDFIQAKVRLTSGTLTEQEEIVTSYAVAKVFNDNQHFDDAWPHYQRANALQLKLCQFTTSELTAFFDNMK